MRHPEQRGGLALAALASLQVAVVAVVADKEPTGGAFAVAVALLLAAPAVWAVEGIAARVAGRRLGLAAAALYVVLPAVGHVFFADTPQLALRTGYNRNVLPFLVGTRAPGWFALGVGLAFALRLGASRAAGVAGLAAAIVGAVLWIDAPWTALYDNFHETTWSPTLVCALPLACALGIGLRSPWAAAALFGWLAFFVLRAAHHPYYTADGGFWPALAAAAPAIAVLIAGLGLLIPRLRTERAPEQNPAASAH